MDNNPWPTDSKDNIHKIKAPHYMKKYIERYKNGKRASKVMKLDNEIYATPSEISETSIYMKKYLDKYLPKVSRGYNSKVQNSVNTYNSVSQNKRAGEYYSISLNPKEKLWKVINYFAKKYNKPISRFLLEIIIKDLVVRLQHEKRNRKNTS